MHHKTESPSLNIEAPQSAVDPTEVQRREKEYLKTIGKLTPDARDMVTGLSSLLMEEDYYNRYKFHIGRRMSLQRALGSLGLDNQEVRTVMNYFNLPYEVPKIRRR